MNSRIRWLAAATAGGLLIAGIATPAAHAKDNCPGKSCDRPVNEQDGYPEKPNKPGGAAATNSVAPPADLPDMVVERLKRTGLPVLWSEIVQLPDGRWIDVMRVASPSMLSGWRPAKPVKVR